MIELLTIASFAGYIIYLRYYADPRSTAEKQADQLREGIQLFQNEQFAGALAYFNGALKKQPKLGVAYLYRARIYRALGDLDAALNDLKTGKSFDNTLAELHLETGEIHYEKHWFDAAFQDFDKAVFHGNAPEAYHWRGLARKKMGQLAEGEQDLAKGEHLVVAAQQVLGTLPPASTRFVDRRLLINGLLVVVNAAVLLLIIKNSPVIHWPYLLASFSAGAIGFAEPRKGWVLAIGQAMLIWVGYRYVIGSSTSSVDREVELFSLYGSMGLTFVGSFLGGIVKRSQ